MAADRSPDLDVARRSLAMAVIGGWLVPGLGQAYVGRPGRAMCMFVAIGSLFAGGLALGAWSCVNPDAYPLEFVAHALIGGPTALAVHLTEGLTPEGPVPLLDVGRLYCAVAGLLNLVAICDAVGAILDARDVASEPAPVTEGGEAEDAGTDATGAATQPEDRETPFLPWPEEPPAAVPAEPRP